MAAAWRQRGGRLYASRVHSVTVWRRELGILGLGTKRMVSSVTESTPSAHLFIRSAVTELSLQP